MKCLLVLVAVCVVSISDVYGAGAGRAIPIATENYVEDLFNRINRGIQYDSTNFLVDLSGNYANCDFASTRSLSVADKTSSDGSSIGVIQDFTYGDGTDTGSVQSYLKPVFDNWVFGHEVYSNFRDQVVHAKTFGCSVRPGCDGRVSVACLFSPAYDSQNIEEDKQKALAFTRTQYKVAERISEQDWDNSHFLENLSGFETDCAMLDRSSWDFHKSKQMAEKHGKVVVGDFGYTVNRDSTPDALRAIMRGMKTIPSKQVGCSVIPDCRPPNDPNMYVVVSCLFEE